MYCWCCGAVLTLGLGKLSFRAVCDKCNAALHSCVNCKYHEQGRANECLIPDTEPVYDRMANNFCEEFSWRTAPPERRKEDQRKRFEDLFNAAEDET